MTNPAQGGPTSWGDDQYEVRVDDDGVSISIDSGRPEHYHCSLDEYLHEEAKPNETLYRDMLRSGLGAEVEAEIEAEVRRRWTVQASLPRDGMGP